MDGIIKSLLSKKHPKCIPIGCVPPRHHHMRGVSLTETPTPGQRPPKQRPLDKEPPDRDPQDSDPLDRDPLDRDLPEWGPPGWRPHDRDRGPLWTDKHL